ncbi:hypothetical protein LAZ67_3002445 [Cordylochernes scorpioides]|uniref:Reverse transcriptase domain-containing protein n=1 Tax=Cordylochernes scorpioides TaxID=51811 RepID=A0ABY6KCG9_9ARAC|nr:hypothetical protein LAZ67_3002445 [Cordylochernes scorpioides]
MYNFHIVHGDPSYSEDNIGDPSFHTECPIEKHEIDICFLQETNVISLDEERDLCHGYSAVVVPSTTTVGSGLACVFAAGIVVHRQQILWPGKVAVIDLTVRGYSMTCINAHVSHAPEERCRQLQIIAALAREEGSAEALAELLDQADLVDIATFFDAALEHTRVATIGSRVDARRLSRILLPSGFCDRVTHYQTIDYAYSDHRAVLIQVGDPAPTKLPCIGKLLRIKANLVAEIRSLRPAVAESGGGYIERASLFLRRSVEDDTARSDYPSLSDLGRSLRARRLSPSTFTDDDGNAIYGGQLRRFLLERLSTEVTPLEFNEWDQLFLADISRDQIAAAIHRLPNGPFKNFFAEVLWQVVEPSRLRGALPPSSRRSKVILLPKVHGGPRLQAFRPNSLPKTDYRVLSSVLMACLRRHLPDLVPQCQTYAVPGRSSSWNIARVSDEAAGASRHDTPLAIISLNLKSAFDTLSRSYLFALLEKLGLLSTFLGWIAVLFGEADASIRVGDVYTKAFPILNGVRQGCRFSAALFSIGVGPLLRRFERTLGRGNVVAYADDIVLFIRDDAQFELVPLIFEEFRMSSGVAVNFTKSCGLWCGSWKHGTDSPLGIFWTSESLTVLDCTITTRNTVAPQASHLMGLLLVLGFILHHLHGYLPPGTTFGRLQAWLARFVWVFEGGVGLFDIAGQLRLACLKGVQASLRGAANGYSWLVRSWTWMTSPAPDVWLSTRRRRRLLSLWESVCRILELNPRILYPASLRSLRLRGDNRFLRPPDLLAPDRWLQTTVGDFSDGAPALVRSTRGALLDAQHLGIFCQRLLQENASSRYHAYQSARRALDAARLQAHPDAELAARWDPTVDVPLSISWVDLLRNCFLGHDADVALRLALHALPHPDHPASRRANCAACGSSDGSLTHRYWSCRAVRPLLREGFASCEMPLDLQAWLFGVGPLLRRFERTLGRGNVVAYADDIVLFIRDDAQFELVPLIFEEFRMSSGVAVNFTKSCGLWCGSWKHGTDSPLGIFWTSESLTVLDCTITTRNTVAPQASHHLGLEAPDVWLSLRRIRLLSLWEAASSVLEPDHRVFHPASLRSLRLRGDNRFLRPPDLLAPERWLQATLGDFSDGTLALARSTRAALLDAKHLGAFCQRLLRENASSSYHAEHEAETIVLRGSATPITRLTSQRARRALDSARIQAHPTAELAARWTPTVDVPRSIPWADLRRNCFSGHDADVALQLALHALPHPDHG